MEKHQLRRLVGMRILVVMILSIMAFSIMSMFVYETEAIGPIDNHFDDVVEFDGTYYWEKTLSDPGSSSDYITYADLRNTHCKYSSTLGACELAVYGADGKGGADDKKIRFDTAEELYRFSVDVSYDDVYLSQDPSENIKLPTDKINFLLGLDYVLGGNINYAVIGSKRFIPIGYSFYDISDVLHENLFDGTFDGQGFAISNLYLADYDELVHEEEKDGSIVDIANSPYYSMFTINKGIITNLGLVNPTLELLTLHVEITKLANIVGENQGTVDHVYVIDSRESVLEAGIRYNVGTSSATYQAAGLIHTNSGSFSNSYYVSKVVVNGAYVNKISAQPVLYVNSGSIAHLVYDSTRYLLLVQVGLQTFPVDAPNAYAAGEATTVLKSTDSDLNQLTNHWYFYPSDTYPLPQGLQYDETDDVYYIHDAIDLVFFSRLITFTSVANGNAYAYSDYVLTDDIDMGVLAPGAYLTPSVTFYGSLSGQNPEGEDLSDNFYIHNLTITKGTLRGTVYYAGLFSILGANSSVSNLNVFDSQISLSNTESYYSSVFYVGMITGRLIAGSISDILLDVDIDLGAQAIGETHAGSLAGLASGSIERVSSSGDIDGGVHSYQSGYSIRPNYYIGGIVGSATGLQLSMTDVVNRGDVYGFGTMSTFSLATGSTIIDAKIGGVIGYILNVTGAIHALTNITNSGDIYIDDIINTTSLPSRQRAGGVFGEIGGLAPVLEEDDEYRFANFYNEGTIYGEYSEGTSDIRVAGIGVTNTTEEVEYALMFNHGTVDYDDTDFVFGTELFFSEYVEGSGTYDKGLEIYNPTASAINLSGYSIQYYSGSSSSPSSTYNLSGTIQPYDVYVIAHSSANSVMRAAADVTFSGGILSFSGDDTLLLRNGTTVIDSIGQQGYDPGTAYTANGVSTINMTLVRKPTISEGRTDYTSSFDPSVEWIGYANGTYTLLGFHQITVSQPFLFTGGIYDVGTSSVTLSRVYNYADYLLDSNYYTSFGPLYAADNSNDSLIRYSANYGAIDYLKSSGATTIVNLGDLNLSGITTAANTDFYNVYNYGNISVVNVNLMGSTLNVAGLTNELSSGHIIRNSINKGTINIGAIDAGGSGSPNIFLGGLVNRNLSIELDEYDEPVATLGIINSINYGEISTTYSTAYFGVLGRSNTFAAGIATLNGGFIQDSANLGAVRIYNHSTSGTTTVSTDTYRGGSILSYTHGTVAAGVVALVLNSDSRVYDTANNGDIVSMAYRYSRAGGIIAVALYIEGEAGGVTGMRNDIGDSEILNGLNFGDVTSITYLIGGYSTNPYNTAVSMRYGTADPASGTTGATIYPDTTVGSNDRPAVYAAAGGVVGYGLSVMKNMLNHGTISGSDVAGGIVGATYVIGSSGTTTTTVDINTAINYGEIKAIDYNDYDAIDEKALSIDDIDGYYLPDGDSFIFPSGMGVDFPRAKRGFGGIFGRLQRGVRGIMSTSGGSFDFIVNANPNIDLIGRLDQDYGFTNSARYFQFNDAIYYSARLNDTTQAVFTGFYYGQLTITAKSGTSAPYTYTSTITNLYLQVGSISTYQSSPGTTGYVFTSSTNLSVGNTTLRYLYSADVPWITEDPLDPNITDIDEEFMYDPGFRMRVEEDLQEFIYYMNVDLLAERFQAGGLNHRENGMYVLSSTAGSTFGSVLPANIDTSLMREINEDYSIQVVGSDDIAASEVAVVDEPFYWSGTAGESDVMNSLTDEVAYQYDAVEDEFFVPGDPSQKYFHLDGAIRRYQNISLNLNYDYVSPTYRSPLDVQVETKYLELRQTVFNDKAELIPSDSIGVVLEEDGGSDTVLANADIDYENKVLTFTISMEAFLENQTTASYNITNALTSAYALIAIRAYDYYGYTPSQAELNAFRELLKDAGESGISTDYPALLEVTLPDKDIEDETSPITIGYFTVYSEAFVGDNLFAHPQYYNDYRVDVIFTPGIAYSTGSTGLTGASFDGGSVVDVSATPTDIRSSGNVGSSGSLRLVFTDTNGVFTEGYDFKNYFVLKYYNGATVSTGYYSVSSEPTTIVDVSGTLTGTYALTFTFFGTTRMGDYYLEYRYFPSSSLNTLYFDKSASSAKAISGFSHYSILDSLSIAGLLIETDINLGYTLDIDSGTDNFTENENLSLPAYQSNLTYDISFMTAGTFVISPFAEITRAQLISTTYTDGYKDYTIEYVVMAEDATTNTYTHHVYERDIDFVSVLRNGNETNPEEVYAAREDSLTTFTVDLGLDQTLDLYNITEGIDSYFAVSVTATSLDELEVYDPEDIVGITYGVDDYLFIYMGFDTIPGIYTFQFYFYRDGTEYYVTLATTLEIKKVEGVSAYLTDIRFSQLSFETSYPTMYTTNSLGVVNTDYYPAVYFAGIDYAGADTAGYQYFKVDGKVSKVPLEQYVPFMLDYLPYGATISRYAYNNGWYWTDEVAYGASSEEQSVLLANFTVFPDTGLEPGEEEEVMILYRVTPEDGNPDNMVYYYVTVTDVEFNATFIFDIYYCSGDPEVCKLASSENSGFNDETVIITVKNYQTLLEGEPADDTVVNVPDPEDYPDFDEIDYMISITTQMNFTYTSDYFYSFARNRSGFFVFNVNLPVDQYFHELYTFEIEYSEYTLNDASDYVAGLEGKYYYIGPSTKNRSRRFNVYIRDAETVETAKPWGLFDFFRSWGDD